VLDRVASWSIQLFGTIHQRHRQDRQTTVRYLTVAQNTTQK